jgi:hypothetical protein
MSRPRPNRFDAIALDTLALAWLARAMWRMSRGRAPWSARRPAR